MKQHFIFCQVRPFFLISSLKRCNKLTLVFRYPEWTFPRVHYPVYRFPVWDISPYSVSSYAASPYPVSPYLSIYKYFSFFIIFIYLTHLSRHSDDELFPNPGCLLCPEKLLIRTTSSENGFSSDLDKKTHVLRQIWS